MAPFLQDFRIAIIEENRCPECLGILNDSGDCQTCGYDTDIEVDDYIASQAIPD